jgi:hypothetical protein
LPANAPARSVIWLGTRNGGSAVAAVTGSTVTPSTATAPSSPAHLSRVLATAVPFRREGW